MLALIAVCSRALEAQGLRLENELNNDAGALQEIQDFSLKGRGDPIVLASHRIYVSRQITGYVGLSYRVVCRHAAASAKQPNDTIRSLLHEVVRRWMKDSVRRDIGKFQRLEAAATRCENDVHRLELGLLIDERKVLGLLCF